MALVLVALPWLLGGCATDKPLEHDDRLEAPEVTVGGVKPYTMLEIAAVDAAYQRQARRRGRGGEGLSVVRHIHRYFETREDQWSSRRLRMDAMLDESQRESALAQLLLSSVSANLSLNPSVPSSADAASSATDAAGGGGGAGDGEGSSGEGGANDRDPKLETSFAGDVVGSAPAQSAFDALPRVRDFYIAYVVTILEQFAPHPSVLDREQLVAQKPKDRLSLHIEARKRALVSVDAMLEDESSEEESEDASPGTSEASSSADFRVQWSEGFSGPVPDFDDSSSRKHLGPDLAAFESFLEKHSPAAGLDEGERKTLRAIRKRIQDRLGYIRLFERRANRGSEGAEKRLLLVTFDANVKHAPEPNWMAGLRVKVKSAKINKETCECEGSSPARHVKILDVYPSRSYDLEDQRYLDRLAEIFELSVAATGGSVGGSVDSENRAESETRRRFLSRVTKIASYQDAPDHEFGWYFYPTNLQVTDRHFLERVAGFLLPGLSASEHEIDAHLQPGPRQCAVLVAVPYSLERFTLEITPQASRVRRDGITNKPRTYNDEVTKELTVDPPDLGDGEGSFRQHEMGAYFWPVASPTGDSKPGEESGGSESGSGKRKGLETTKRTETVETVKEKSGSGD